MAKSTTKTKPRYEAVTLFSTTDEYLGCAVRDHKLNKIVCTSVIGSKRQCKSDAKMIANSLNVCWAMFTAK